MTNKELSAKAEQRKKMKSNLEERLIDFAVRIILFF
jgi:hypothetical protein